MHLFALAALIMVVIHVVGAVQRPRVAVIVSAILWLLYAVYEHMVATVGCDGDCNIRVDLVFFFPLLGLVTYCAYQSYMGRPSPLKAVAIVLGVIGLVVFGLVAEGYGYGVLANVLTVGALAFGLVYAIRSRSRTDRS